MVWWDIQAAAKKLPRLKKYETYGRHYVIASMAGGRQGTFGANDLTRIQAATLDVLYSSTWGKAIPSLHRRDDGYYHLEAEYAEGGEETLYRELDVRVSRATVEALIEKNMVIVETLDGEARPLAVVINNWR